MVGESEWTSGAVILAVVADVTSRGWWACCLIGIVALGIVSRVVHTGLPIFDKDLGDALYAAMVYAIMRQFFRPVTAAIFAMAAMTIIELFQLTLIPAHMLESGDLLVQLCARLLGTAFSVRDLFAYAIGIGMVHLAGLWFEGRRSRSLQ